ncbi:MAG: hypothetical protein ASARMPRED_004791 [Alectoria sarmentosa]|nr:MAG: hypothetical protein ASARMPRED_004791 [Alectoria sarmentosa]
MANSKPQQWFGIKELYSPGPNAEIDIVAVHGLNGDAFTTWTSDKGNICWLNHQDLLPKYMPNARILTWGYNANVTSLKGRSTSSDRVLQHAQTLVADLQADRALEGAESRPIIFLCHSLGGIVVKRALAYSTSRTASKIAHLHSIYTCTYGLVFFGTPHHGARHAHLAHSLQKLAAASLPRKALETDAALLRALERDSEVLQDISDHFAPLLPRFCVFFLWEQERSDLKYTRDYVVDESSAAPLVGGTERAGIAADHGGMCKFDSKDAPGFRTVVAALRRYGSEAPAVVRERNRAAARELGVKGWCEARELVRGVAGGEDLPRITGGGGGGAGFEKENVRHEYVSTY